MINENSLFNNSQVGLIRLTGDCDIEQINPAFCKLLGYESLEQFLVNYADKKFSSLFFGFNDQNKHNFLMNTEEKTSSFEGYVSTKDGSKVYSNLFLWKVINEDGELISVEGVLLPFKDVQNDVSILRRYNLIIQSIHTIAEEFLQSSYLEPSMEKVLSSLGKATGTNRVFLFQNKWGLEDDLQMHLNYDWADTSTVPVSGVQLKMELSYIRNGLERWMDMLSQNQIISGCINDFLPSERVFFKKLGVKSISLIPIPVQLDWWGFLCFASVDEEQSWFDEEFAAVRVSANIIGAAIQRQQMEAEISKNEEKFRMAADFTQNWEYWAAPDGEFIYSSPAFNQITGFNFSYVKHNIEVFKRITHPEDLQRVELSIQDILINREKGNFEFRIVTKEGETRWVNQVSVPVFDDHGKYLGQRASNQDVTSRKKAEEELQEFNQVLNQNVRALERINYVRMLLNQMGNQLHSCKEMQKIYDVASSFCRKIFPDASGVVYILQEKKYIRVSTFGRYESKIFEIPCGEMQKGGCGIEEFNPIVGLDTTEIFREEQEQYGGALLGIPLLAQQKLLGFIQLFSFEEEDIEDYRLWGVSAAERTALAIANLNLQEMLKHQSNIDPLTGLYNRRFMTEVLERKIRKMRQQDGEFAILMMDIDDFKTFNDQYGHDIGDMIIQEVGAFLRENVREEDYACRYGGDEFTIILPRVSLENATTRIMELQQDLRKLRFEKDDLIIDQTTFSIGLASFPVHGDSYENLLKAADRALYRSKHEGKDKLTIAKPLEG